MAGSPKRRARREAELMELSLAHHHDLVMEADLDAMYAEIKELEDKAGIAPDRTRGTEHARDLANDRYPPSRYRRSPGSGS